ncbi:TolB family protein [Mesobacillus zeae]|uniref:DUF5050 domain-containing protein n=1 Tax=Mesobacillus zeae TaxID=1917180 RepID=A0A398BKM7_9BACI|nr:PD40 domain-containing protein [Mesobacillus zeae]RID88310.1 hypothetical protein D1970_02100 [Mesobacillus zeae]
MKKTNKRLLTAIALVAILLISSVAFLLMRENDHYKYFTGLGNKISLSHDDRKFAFSYYQDGKEAIYASRTEGGKTEKLTNPAKDRHRQPVFSSDGKKILYLSANPDKVQSLHIMNADGSHDKKLTNDKLSVGGAIFSADGKQIFFSGFPSKELGKAEGESKEGSDLFSVSIDGKNQKKLTDQDFYTMENLMLSSNGDKIILKDFDDLKEYDLKDTSVSSSSILGKLPSQSYNIAMSPDNIKAAYTAVTKESKNSSLYKYELFFTDFGTGKKKQLTNLKSAIDSPVFFHKENKIAFLHNTNWAGEPVKFKLMTVNTETKETAEIGLDLPKSIRSNIIMKAIDYSVNDWTVGLLYTALLCLSTYYLRHGKVYRPGLISLGLSLLTFASSFIIAAKYDPWAGIAVGGLAVAVFICSILALIFAFIVKRFVS